MTDRELMQQALDYIIETNRVSSFQLVPASRSNQVITALRERLAQPEQEPVAWMTFDAAGEEDDIWYDNPDGKLLEGWTYKPLYTAPPRQWQGLTDEDVDEVERWIEFKEEGSGRIPTQKLVRYIEAKLKAKNS